MTAQPHFDLAIIGGGPSGQAAAEAACGAGLQVVMLDEQAQMGGQILRSPPVQFSVQGWLEERSYRPLKAQLARAAALSGLDFRGRTSVLGVFPQRGAGGGFDLRLASPDGGGAVSARRVLVAAGCYDLPVALPGWTTPGVMSVGAIQAFVKSQQVTPGHRFVLAGTHPLQLILAQQLVAAGGQVAAVIFAQSAAVALGVLQAPVTAARHAGKLLDAARAMAALRLAGVPILFGRSAVRVLGDNEVSGLEIAGASGGVERIACDRVGFCYGFAPQSDLPRAMGAAFRWAAPAGGWAIEHDSWMRSSVPGLYVAGEVTGVAGAPAALAKGEIAGFAVLLDEGRLDAAQAEQRAGPARRRLASLTRFSGLLDAMSDPTGHLPAVDPGTVICRCEDVTEAQLSQALAGVPAPGRPNAVKLTTRAGMGLCQGRSCEHAIVRRLAKEGSPPSADLAFTARFPSRPARIGDLID